MNSPKTAEDFQQNDEKLRQKDTQRSGTMLPQTRPQFSFLIVVIKDNFALNNNILLISHLAYTLIYSILNIGKKLKHFKRLNYVDTDNTLHRINLTSNVGLSSYQTVLPSILHSEIWFSVWMGNLSKITFLHLIQCQQYLDFWNSHDRPSLLSFYPVNFPKFCIFCSFCKLFTLCLSRKNFEKLIVIQMSTLAHISVQSSCSPNNWFCGFVLFWRTKWVSLIFPIIKDSKFFKNVYIFQFNI